MYDKSTRVLYMLQQLLQKNMIEKERLCFRKVLIFHTEFA